MQCIIILTPETKWHDMWGKPISCNICDVIVLLIIAYEPCFAHIKLHSSVLLAKQWQQAGSKQLGPQASQVQTHQTFQVCVLIRTYLDWHAVNSMGYMPLDWLFACSKPMGHVARLLWGEILSRYPLMVSSLCCKSLKFGFVSCGFWWTERA